MGWMINDSWIRLILIMKSRTCVITLIFMVKLSYFPVNMYKYSGYVVNKSRPRHFFSFLKNKIYFYRQLLQSLIKSHTKWECSSKESSGARSRCSGSSGHPTASAALSSSRCAITHLKANVSSVSSQAGVSDGRHCFVKDKRSHLK